MISIRNMKTKEQILKWLDKQPWKGEFYEAAFTLRPDLNLSYNDLFISEAFLWDKTKQGQNVWAEREHEFSEWYDSNDKPMSWEEYCKQNPITDGACYIDDSSIITPIFDSHHKDVDNDINVMTKELCKAFLAYMKLIQLRNAWVKDCENGDKDGYLKIVYTAERGFYYVYLGKTGLSFPTSSMAEEFINTFKDLLEEAKTLI